MIPALRLTVSALALFSLHHARAQYVTVNAEIELTERLPGTVKPNLWTVQCTVGTNCWKMDGDFSLNSQTTYWFTGTNIIEHSVVTKNLPEQWLKSGIIKGAPIGAENNRITESVDGNPGTLASCGPGGHKLNDGPDCLCTLGRIAWLAFCSSPCLKREGHQLFPPKDIWKELICAPSGFSDRTTTYVDSLGLPKTVDLLTSNGQVVLQYRVLLSTNVAGWRFPTEFYLAQYRPANPAKSRESEADAWVLDMTAKGKVTAIAAGTKPQIPPAVLKTR